MMLRPDEIARWQADIAASFRLSCAITRAGPDSDSVDTTCSVRQDGREIYPFGAIPNQPVQQWQVHLPAGTGVQPNDAITLPDGRIFVCIYQGEPGANRYREVAHCILSATEGKLGDAYVRPNATVTCKRTGQLTDTGRRVHLTWAMANPAAALEKAPAFGGASIPAVLFDLPGADWLQGDAVEITQLDGVLDGVPDSLQLTLAQVQGVVRRPLPFAILQADLNFTIV